MQAVGAPVRQFVDRLEASGLAASRECVDVLRAVVDDDFKRHCRLAVVGRRLFVNVNQESRVYAMRMRWEARLRKSVASYRHRLGVSDVVFGFGETGARLI
ncbi:MAG: hypothetical protein PVI86_04670 [Phycisphaerae bacterium]